MWEEGRERGGEKETESEGKKGRERKEEGKGDN